MIRRMLRSPHTWIMIAFLVLIWPLAAYPRGIVKAYLDHAFGRLELRTYGFPLCIWDECYCKRLEERYQVHVIQTGDCQIWPHVAWYANGYNHVSVPLIKQRFGKDVFEDCFSACKAPAR